MEQPDTVRPGVVDYPESDGRPMGESPLHREAMVDAIQTLEDHFAPRFDHVHVAGNNMVYFVEGDWRRAVSPDVYVVNGLPHALRPTYRTWEEGRTISFALEVTSKSTRREDQRRKLACYRDELHVPEYFLFDPTGDWIRERLRAYRLTAGAYEPIAPLPSGRLLSRELDLELAVVGDKLRFFLPGAADPLPTRAERIEQERAGRLRAEERAEQAEAELRRLRRLLGEDGRVGD